MIVTQMLRIYSIHMAILRPSMIAPRWPLHGSSATPSVPLRFEPAKCEPKKKCSCKNARSAAIQSPALSKLFLHDTQQNLRSIVLGGSNRQTVHLFGVSNSVLVSRAQERIPVVHRSVPIATDILPCLSPSGRLRSLQNSSHWDPHRPRRATEACS